MSSTWWVRSRSSTEPDCAAGGGVRSVSRQRRPSKHSPAILVAAGVTLAGLLCSPIIQAGAAGAAPTLVWGLGGDPNSLDYPATYNGEAGPVVTQIFNTLVRMKAGGTAIEPDLATSWSVSPDGRTWTFTLRRGVTFHDGTPWTAQAAKFNIDRWADARNPYTVMEWTSPTGTISSPKTSRPRGPRMPTRCGSCSKRRSG